MERKGRKEKQKKQEKQDTAGQNVVKYQRRFRLNIGIVVFAFVLIYFLVYLFQYLTTTHVTVYEVQEGQIMVSTHYTGLALRSEQITYSDQSGRLNYYSSEGEKAGYGDLVCSVDSEGSLSEEITAAGLDASALSTDDLLDIQTLVTDYAFDYSEEQFYNVYSFGNNLNAAVQESLYLDALERLGSQTDAGSFTKITAGEDGILAFYLDGYEEVTPENFTADLYSAGTYQKQNLKKETTAAVGQALFKTVTDENWYLLIPLDQETREQYEAQLSPEEETFLLSVTFKKDEAQMYATAELRSYDGQDFLLLSFNNSMIRYLSDRYLEVEIGSGENVGLKIPNTAIVQKEFLMVPPGYICTGNNSSGIGVILIGKDRQGEETAEFAGADIYYIDEKTGNYYIAGEKLSRGSTIQMPDSTDRYQISATEFRDGVYNVNKGYAVFKLIHAISSNGEYTIVESGTSFGLSLYDRIALNGDTIEEGEYAN